MYLVWINTPINFTFSDDSVFFKKILAGDINSLNLLVAFAKTKTQISCLVTAQLFSAFCLRYIDSTIPLLPRRFSHELPEVYYPPGCECELFYCTPCYRYA